jgi:hypothetical protein
MIECYVPVAVMIAVVIVGELVPVQHHQMLAASVEPHQEALERMNVHREFFYFWKKVYLLQRLIL